MGKINGVRQRKGWVDTGRANAKLRDFAAKPEVDVSALGVQVGPSTPKPGSRLKPDKKGASSSPKPAAVASAVAGHPHRHDRS